jgi:hypothetical protein
MQTVKNRQTLSAYSASNEYDIKHMIFVVGFNGVLSFNKTIMFHINRKLKKFEGEEFSVDTITEHLHLA